MDELPVLEVKTASAILGRASELSKKVRRLRADLIGLGKLDRSVDDEPHWCTKDGLDPLCTDRQKAMLWHMEKMGHLGVVYLLSLIALDEAQYDERYAPSDPIDSILESADFQDRLSEAVDDVDDVVDDHEGTCPPLYLRQRDRTDRDATPVLSSLRSQAVQKVDTSEPSQSLSSNNHSSPQTNPAQLSSSPPMLPSSPTNSQTSINDLYSRVLTCNKSWRLILDDWANHEGRTLSHYISSLHPRVIEGLIKGDLPRQLEEDQDFRDEVKPLLEPVDRQGVYIVYVSIKRQRASTPADREKMNQVVGMGLSPQEIVEIYHDMEKYINVADTTNMAWAKEVDRIRSGNSGVVKTLDYTQERRYGSGASHDKFVRHREFMHFLKEYYVKWYDNCRDVLDKGELTAPLRKCFAYVGLAQDVLQRCTEHWNHSGHISPVFGLFTALLAKRFGDKFEVKNSTFQIFRTTNPADIGLDEKLLTLLASAYPWDGGLSTAFAGLNLGSQGRRDPKRRDRNMAASRQDIVDAGYQAINSAQTERKFEQLEASCDDSQSWHDDHTAMTILCDAKYDQVKDIKARLEICAAVEAVTEVMKALNKAEAAPVDL